MRFLETSCKNFRNLKTSSYVWGGRLNLLLGPNGAGKTNLLESLSLLSGWGPLAGGGVSPVISWSAPEQKALLSASVSGERDFDVLALLSSRATLRARGERVSSTELRSLLPSLSFLPSDINLIDGSPSVRRFFLDKLCALWVPVYARRLSEYRQLMRHRAALLRQNRSVSATTPPIVQLGGWVQDCRRALVRLLQDSLSSVESSLLPQPVFLSVDPCIPKEISGSNYLAAMLERTKEKERYAGRPLVGPHREDLKVICQERPAALCFSRGQKRRLVISLTLAAGRVIASQLRLKPVLLFDDLGAELDQEGKKLAGEALFSSGWQIFVTGTENPFPNLKNEVEKEAIHTLALD